MLSFFVAITSCEIKNQQVSDSELYLKAKELADKFIIVDTHIDVPYRMRVRWEDISQRTERGNFDFPRAIEGGLNVPFMSIYIPPDYETKGGAKELADTLIDMVENFTIDWHDKFSIVTSVTDVLNQSSSGKILLAMGMENGSPIEGKLENVQYFYKRGIRYITLAHGKNNHISDSSYDEERKWNGLSPFGKEVVAEMNRVGIMVDVSHISDSAFYQVIEISKAPVIASHSSCRHFTPGFERNMSDDMIKKLAENGGVIQINFGSTFLKKEIYEKDVKNQKELLELREKSKMNPNDTLTRKSLENFRKEKHPGYADVKDAAVHIDHVVKLVGIDHVGLGSDFDGLGDSLPVGLKDVSQYPNLIYELLKNGYSEEDIEKICSGNILRVWFEVERIASESQ
jgi:membrane dipeptidase